MCRSMIGDDARHVQQVIKHVNVQVHDDPNTSPADAPTQWPLRHLEQLLTELIAIANVTKGKEPFHIDLTPYDPDRD